MSTKIYNGYKFKKCLSLPKLSLTLSAAKKSLTEIAKSEWLDRYASLYVAHLDNVNFDKEDESLTVDRIVDNEIEEAIKDIKLRQRRHSLDFEVEICIKEYNGTIYCGLFAQNNALLDKAVEALDLEHYYYFDNADKPHEINDADWLERSMVWNGILGYQSWTDAGFLSYELIRVEIIRDWIQFSDLDHSSFDRAVRAKTWSRRKVIDIELKKSLEDNASPSNYIKVIRQIENDIASHLHDNALSEWSEFFMQNAPEITVDNFKTLKPWAVSCEKD